MSAFANQSALAPAPAQPVAPPPKTQPAKPRSPWRWVGLLAVVAIAAGAYVYLRPQRETQKQAGAGMIIRTAKAQSGTLQKTIRLSGTTSARSFANIVAPMMRGPDAGRALVLMSIAKSGTMVKKGDVVAQIDPQTIKDHVDDIESQVIAAEADITKRKAQQAIEEETLRQTLTAAKAAWDKAKLDYGAQEIRTVIDQELLKLTMEEAEATYKEYQANLELTKKDHASEIRILELTRDRQVRHRDRHKVDVMRFTIHTPINGLVVMQSIFRGGDMGQVQEGDQVSPGQPFMKIVDPASMQIDAYVNQVESEGIRIGQEAPIGLDAFPGLTLPGRIRSVGALAVSLSRSAGNYIRNIPVSVQILGSDPRVIPDLSASADVVLEKKSDTVVVPLEAVHQEKGQTVVYVKSAGGFQPVPVKLGLGNKVQTEVLSGVKPGDELALQNPQAKS